MPVEYIILYVLMTLLTLLLLSEHYGNNPFIIKIKWAFIAALLWPVTWVCGVGVILWTFVGGVLQYFKAEK